MAPQEATTCCSAVTEAVEGRNMVTSWIISHTTEAGNLMMVGTLTNTTKKSIYHPNLQIILNV